MTRSLLARGAELCSTLTGRTVAAVATPMDAQGRLDAEVVRRYAAAISARVDAVCVWAHTGRGLHLSRADRELVLGAFRAAHAGPVLAAVGPAGTLDGFDDQLRSTLELAAQAAALGADGLMVYPMSSLQDEPTRRERAVRLHREVAETVGLPVIGFYLYARAGGVAYSPQLLAELCEQPGVVGVKLALLDDAIRCQDAITAIRGAGGLAITGEDRMLGPSLMWGADSVLVGLGAAAPQITTDAVNAWFAGDAAAFVAASRRLDAFAAVMFREPMDAYVQRMLWVAAEEGLITNAFAHDFHGARIDSERPAVLEAYRQAMSVLDPQAVDDGRPAGRSRLDDADPLGQP